MIFAYEITRKMYVFRDGEADSKSYPGKERVTSAGVIALALRSLAVPEHLRVRLALCSAVQVGNNHENIKFLLIFFL